MVNKIEKTDCDRYERKPMFHSSTFTLQRRTSKYHVDIEILPKVKICFIKIYRYFVHGNSVMEFVFKINQADKKDM